MIEVIAPKGSTVANTGSLLTGTKSALVRTSMALVLFFLPLSETSYQQLLAAVTPTCASSTPGSAAYSVTVCLTNPADASTLTGNTTITATVSVSGGTSPGIQRAVFYLDGAYLLTDYQSAYTFILPTNRSVDGRSYLGRGSPDA